MGYKGHGIDTEGVPLEFVQTLLRWYEINHFIESGSGGGDSIRAVAPFFKHCYTIEVVKGRYIEEGLQNVWALTGDSVEIIPELLKGITEDEWVLFWLDAHFSDSIPNATGKKECPIIEELNVIATHRKSIILIDDARLFLGTPPPPNDPTQWPRIEDIFAECKKLFTFHWTTILDDYILCYPHEFRNVIEWEWHHRYHLRYPSTEAKLKTATQDVYRAFKKYIE